MDNLFSNFTTRVRHTLDRARKELPTHILCLATGERERSIVAASWLLGAGLSAEDFRSPEEWQKVLTAIVDSEWESIAPAPIRAKLKVRINQWLGTVGLKGPVGKPFWGVIVTTPDGRHYGQRVAKDTPGTRDQAMALAKEIRSTRYFDISRSWSM